MPIIKSAKKRMRTAKKATVRNAKTKRSIKAAIKDLTKSITGGKKTAAKEFQKAQSEIDKAAKKNVLHKNKAARKKRQLAKAAKIAGVGVAGVAGAAAAKKVASKKATSNKSAKKPAAKPKSSKSAAKPKTAKK